MHSFKKTLLTAGVMFLAVLLLPDTGWAQDLHPSRRASPLGMARTFVGDTYVKVTYSRPYKRGRDNVFGDAEGAMHANGQIWRFGANEPTEITFSGPVTVAGKEVEAGTYSIFATPGATAWKLHVNELRGGGANEYDAANDVVVAEVEVGTPADGEVDQFTIAFTEVEGGVHMVTTWLDIELLLPIMSGSDTR